MSDCKSKTDVSGLIGKLNAKLSTVVAICLLGMVWILVDATLWITHVLSFGQALFVFLLGFPVFGAVLSVVILGGVVEVAEYAIKR